VYRSIREGRTIVEPCDIPCGPSEAEELLLRAFFNRMRGAVEGAVCLEAIVIREQPPGFSWELYAHYVLACAKHYASLSINIEAIEPFFACVDRLVMQMELSSYLYLDTEVMRAYVACSQNDLITTEARVGIADIMIAQGLTSPHAEALLDTVRRSLRPSS
jgi:hypothetical protein